MKGVPDSNPPPPRRGFTVLELVIAIVILAVLATIAIPSFDLVLRHTSATVTATNLTTLARDTASLAVQAQAPATTAQLTSATHEVLPGATLLPSSTTAPSPSTNPSQISYVVTSTPGGTSLVGLAASSGSGCAYTLLTGTSTQTWTSTTTPCTGIQALLGPPASPTTTTTAPGPPLVLATPIPAVIENVTDASGASMGWSWTPAAVGVGTLTYYWSLSPAVTGCASGATTQLSLTCSDLMTPGTTYTFSVYAQSASGVTSGVGSVTDTQVTAASTTTTTTSPGTTTTTAPGTTTTTPTTTTTIYTPPNASAYPLYLLSNPACSSASPVLALSGSAEVISGGGYAPIGVRSPCPASVALTGAAQLLASAIATPDSALNTYCYYAGTSSKACSTSNVGPLETYVVPPANPFAGLAAPAYPAPGSSVSCSPDGDPITCPAGYYASSPALGSHAKAGVTFASGVTTFASTLVITSGARVTFAGGTYWFPAGLVATDNSSITFGPGTYIFGGPAGASACPNTSCLSLSSGVASTTTTAGALLYVAAGGAQLMSAASTTLYGSSAYDGIAVWDAAASGSNYPLIVSNSGKTNDVFGGIYVPNGQVLLTGNGNTQATFVESASATLSANGHLIIGG